MMNHKTTPPPLLCYEQQINSGILQPDARQKQVIGLLDTLYQSLIQPKHFLEKFHLKKTKIPKGVYLWGSVGTGKTHLIDIFFHAIPFEKKLRIHFHAFMQVVHTELAEHNGKKNPLRFVAKEIADKASILCLDELIVNDVTDAMLLAQLFKYLYEYKVCVLFTSNIEPDRLYENGLQRQRFIPAIEFIKSHSSIVELSSNNDYRQQYKEHSHNYIFPYDDIELEQRFQKLHEGEVTNKSLTLYGREIQVIKRAKNILWCDFTILCGVPRSQKDFLQLAKEFPIIMVSNLCNIKKDQNNLIRSFINLIDVLYDNQSHLIISAESPIHEIYTEGRFLFAFARTQSRITEMQAEDW